MKYCSILIVNWNSWDLLYDCLTALSKQTYRNFKVIVFDNASDQAPPDKIFTIFPDLKLVQSEKNIGFACANNRLLELVNEQEWVVFLNPDVIPQNDWLEQLIKASENYPQFSCFGSRLLMFENPSLIDGVGDIYHLSGLAWRRGHGQNFCTETKIFREVFSTCAAAAMCRRDAIQAVGGFDEDFFCYFEDVDLGFRLRLAGYRSLSVPTSVALHHGYGTTGSRHSEAAVYYGHRNLVWTYIKNMPGFMFWLFLPLHIILNVATIVYFVLHNRYDVIIRSKKDAICGIPLIWRKRIEIQAKRKISFFRIFTLMDKHPLPRISKLNGWLGKYFKPALVKPL
ncbi:glycosyltransferase family 2 protein [Thermodesulfobacteriota bacterium]